MRWLPASRTNPQIRKLYEPHLFPGARAIPVFDRVFGSVMSCHGPTPTIPSTHSLDHVDDCANAWFLLPLRTVVDVCAVCAFA
jgi:hypothetical protein